MLAYACCESRGGCTPARSNPKSSKISGIPANTPPDIVCGMAKTTNNGDVWTYLAIQKLVLTNHRKILGMDAFLGAKGYLAIGPSSSVHALEKLTDRLLIFDAFLHLARRELELVTELWQRSFDEILGGHELFLWWHIWCAH
jgi:hypothetical protein